MMTANEMRCMQDAVFILKWLQKEYCVNGEKLCMCLVGLDIGFGRVQLKVLEWVMRKKGIPEVLVISVMSVRGINEDSVCILICQWSMQLKWGLFGFFSSFPFAVW